MEFSEWGLIHGSGVYQAGDIRRAHLTFLSLNLLFYNRMFIIFTWQSDWELDEVTFLKPEAQHRPNRGQQSHLGAWATSGLGARFLRDERSWLLL